MSVAVDVANHLEAQGIGIIGADIFIGPIRPEGAGIPADAVFVLATGGRQGQRIHSSLGELRFPSVQIMVRATSYEAGNQKSVDILNVIEGALLLGFWDARSLQSEPIFLEQDENFHYFWSQNHELKFETGVV